MPDACLSLPLIFAAAAEPGLFEQVSLFFEEGGSFMILLGLTSVAGLAAIVFKFLSLSRSRIIPGELAAQLESIDATVTAGRFESLLAEFEKGGSTLARLCAAAVRYRHRPTSEMTEAVQSMARGEIVRLHAGMTVIDVVISVAPLLGLLGTASGLVVVFSGLESDADRVQIALGIGRALKTTIVGLAIAVPAIIAQGVFQRRIDTYAARLEVLLTKLTQAFGKPPAIPG